MLGEPGGAVEDSLDEGIRGAVFVFGDVVVDEGRGGEDVIVANDTDFGQAKLDGLLIEGKKGHAAATQTTHLG